MVSYNSFKQPVPFRALIGEDAYSWFLESCKQSGKQAFYKPDETVWNKRQKMPIGFRVVLTGCIAVWDNTFRENTIDALIVPGQVVGDFEMFEYASENFELRTLSECTLACATPEITQELRSKLGDSKFYEVLSELFIGKLLFQNKVVKWRFRGLKRRFAKFIDAFVHDKMWRQLTTIGNQEALDVNQIAEFLIDLTFDVETFKSILTCDDRGIEPLLGKWVDDRIIDLELYNSDFETEGVANVTMVTVPNKKKGTIQVPHVYIPNETPYFKISVIDYRGLRAEVDLY